MPDFDWEEFLDLAEQLVQRRGDPAAERTAISRAYYAVFHKASAYLIRQGERLTFTGEDHAFVWRWFRMRGDRLSRAIGQNGRRLIDARRRADYDPAEYRSLFAGAATAVRLARQTLADLGTLP